MEEWLRRVKQKHAAVMATCVELHDMHSTIQTEQNELVNSVLTKELFQSCVSQIRFRYMKSAHAARHPGRLHAALNYQMSLRWHCGEREGRRCNCIMRLCAIELHLSPSGACGIARGIV